MIALGFIAGFVLIFAGSGYMLDPAVSELPECDTCETVASILAIVGAVVLCVSTIAAFP